MYAVLAHCIPSAHTHMWLDCKLMCEGHVQVVPEPVAEWQAVNGSTHNILDAFYNAPERYAYTFQNYVFLTRCNQVLPTSPCFTPL